MGRIQIKGPCCSLLQPLTVPRVPPVLRQAGCTVWVCVCVCVCVCERIDTRSHMRHVWAYDWWLRVPHVSSRSPLASVHLHSFAHCSCSHSLTADATQPSPFAAGGVWKNTEDEILKAAVMKYGTYFSLGTRCGAQRCARVAVRQPPGPLTFSSKQACGVEVHRLPPATHTVSCAVAFLCVTPGCALLCRQKPVVSYCFAAAAKVVQTVQGSLVGLTAPCRATRLAP